MTSTCRMRAVLPLTTLFVKGQSPRAAVAVPPLGLRAEVCAGFDGGLGKRGRGAVTATIRFRQRGLFAVCGEFSTLAVAQGRRSLGSKGFSTLSVCRRGLFAVYGEFSTLA